MALSLTKYIAYDLIYMVTIMNERYESLKLNNQLCFPLYSVANKIIRSYTPLLEDLDLTYTQYIAMMVLWEKEDINEKELGDTLFLKSNTLTPLLKKLEAKGYVRKTKNDQDGRSIMICLTDKGRKLKDKAVNIPEMISKKVNLSADEAVDLYRLLYKMMDEKCDEQL